MKQSEKKGDKNKTGAYGEEIAARYLENKGMRILQRNYLKKWGEIDIVARETSRNSTLLRFIEVKTVSYETKQALTDAVSRGTWRPEENIHEKKLQRMYRAIESWLMENDFDCDWEIDAVAVRIVPREKYATVKYMRNLIR